MRIFLWVDERKERRCSQDKKGDQCVLWSWSESLCLSNVKTERWSQVYFLTWSREMCGNCIWMNPEAKPKAWELKHFPERRMHAKHGLGANVNATQHPNQPEWDFSYTSLTAVKCWVTLQVWLSRLALSIWPLSKSLVFIHVHAEQRLIWRITTVLVKLSDRHEKCLLFAHFWSWVTSHPTTISSIQPNTNQWVWRAPPFLPQTQSPSFKIWIKTAWVNFAEHVKAFRGFCILA